jgi:hypothetical protein
MTIVSSTIKAMLASRCSLAHKQPYKRFSIAVILGTVTSHRLVQDGLLMFPSVSFVGFLIFLCRAQGIDRLSII